jgi:hypothetical protein
MQRYFLATNDVESTSIRFNKQRAKTAEKVVQEGIPLLLNLYRELGIKSTFFITGELAEKYPDAVRMVIPDGHEVACHGYSHEDSDAFDSLGYHEQKKQLDKAKGILEDISGTKVISFRAPALRVNEFTVRALEDSGFEIDSSIASQRADNLFSFGAFKKLNRLSAPRLPYFTSKNSLAVKGDSDILEVPISAFIIPYIGTFMRLNPVITGFLRSALSKETKITGKPVNFLIHPIECILESDEDEMGKRSTNVFKYLLAEKLRTYLKQKNLGSVALTLYQEQLKFFIEKGFKFSTMSHYKHEAFK